MNNSKPLFSALVRFHNWFDPMAKPWAKWAYLSWMFAAFASLNLGLQAAAFSNGTSGVWLALSGLSMLYLWFGTRYYWLYHTEILPKRAWSRYRGSGR